MKLVFFSLLISYGNSYLWGQLFGLKLTSCLQHLLSTEALIIFFLFVVRVNLLFRAFGFFEYYVGFFVAPRLSKIFFLFGSYLTLFSLAPQKVSAFHKMAIWDIHLHSFSMRFC